MAGDVNGPRRKDGSYINPEDLAAYQQSWNKANGANADYSSAMAAGRPAGGSVPLLQAPQGYVGPSAGPTGVYGGGAAPAAPSVPAGFGTGASTIPNASSFTAQTNPALTALQGRYDTYLNGLEKNSGQIMDQAAQKFRDIREGGKTSLMQSEGIRGVAGSNKLGQYESDTARGEQSAVADVNNAREAMLGGALQGDLAIAKAPADQALAEKGFGLNVAEAQAQQAQAALSGYLALINSQRQSPIFTPTASYGY